MTRRRLLVRHAVSIGLGLLAGAVLHGSALAQADTARARRDTIPVRRGDSVRVSIPARPPADSMRRDSLFVRDSLHPPPPRPPTDTLKASFTRAPIPTPIEIGDRMRWSRDALFATGALTVLDLLDRVPGLTGLRSGWIASPMVAPYLGDARRTRFFYDGLELDELDPRTGGVYDVSQIPIWSLEELRIERGATEVRVYMRSWRVDRTTPSTRVDVATGDQQTNAYRGFFGRRYQHGEGIQVAAQQYGTQPPQRSAPSSDQIALLGRVGYARNAWSADAYAIRISRTRGRMGITEIRDAGLLSDSIASLASVRLDSYLRVGYRDPESSGVWFQAIAGLSKYTIDRDSGVIVNSSGTDTIQIRDTSRSRSQYVVSAGVTRGALRLTGEERLRVLVGGQTISTPALRAEWTSGPLAVAGYAEGRGVDSVARVEASARISPLPFLSATAAVGRTRDDSDLQLLESGGTSYARAEGGVRLAGVWFLGGMLHRGAVGLAGPRVYADSIPAVYGSDATGITAAVRGRVYGPIQIDLSGVRWSDSAAWYRPQYQTRSEVFLATNWLSRFPSGNFGILASAMHEYRSSTQFPLVSGGALSAQQVPDSRVLTARLEIRIVSAVVSYQFRNVRGEQYQLVPGYLMPRLTQIYGVRWDFWN